VSNKISTAVSESLSKQQKEFFLRQQLAAIQKELTSLHGSDKGKSKKSDGEMDLDLDDENEVDELANLKRKIEGMINGSEEKKVGAREYRRLKRIPQGSVEQGVLRSYVSKHWYCESLH
jgi:ATP-dependent Lon protease